MPEEYSAIRLSANGWTVGGYHKQDNDRQEAWFLTYHGVPEWNAESLMYLLIRERPLLQGVPSFKIVHRTILKFTLCGAHDVGAVALCGGRQWAPPLDPASLLKKA